MFFLPALTWFLLYGSGGGAFSNSPLPPVEESCRSHKPRCWKLPSLVQEAPSPLASSQATSVASGSPQDCWVPSLHLPTSCPSYATAQDEDESCADERGGWRSPNILGKDDDFPVAAKGEATQASRPEGKAACACAQSFLASHCLRVQERKGGALTGVASTGMHEVIGREACPDNIRVYGLCIRQQAFSLLSVQEHETGPGVADGKRPGSRECSRVCTEGYFCRVFACRPGGASRASCTG